MSIFHVNAEGNAGTCRAENGNCPFGDASEHYASAEAAREGFEREMGSGFEISCGAINLDIDVPLAVSPQDTPDCLDDVRDFAETATVPLLDANGQYGDYLKLDRVDRMVFEEALALVDKEPNGECGTAWINGEPFDDQAQHQYIECVVAGLEVMDDYHREFGSHNAYMEEHGATIQAFYALRKRV